MSLSGWADLFHKWMLYKRGDIDKRPEIRLKVPKEIEEILFELRSREDDSAAWISFALLDMSDKGLDAIAQAVREIKSQQITPTMFRRLAILVDEVMIVVIGSRDLSSTLLRERTHLRLMIEMYRRKASKGIGLGIMLADSSKPFDCAAWAEGPWQYDEKMQQMLESEPRSMPAPGQKLPGRNHPCICGSGKKFKRCCLPKIGKEAKKNIQG